MRFKQIAWAVSLVFVAGPALAQSPQAPAAQKVEKVEVTGTSIKRVTAETAMPLTIITRQDIERAGITSAEELMFLISANGNGNVNLSSLVGVLPSTDRGNYGNSSANLRGLGAANTLVLLNGRRVSTHGLKGATVDLNSIPLAAVERVEILRDGASAIYGTDAIGGVINFILRKDYEGAQATVSTDMTQEGGGNIHRGSVVAGYGSLAKDRFNLMATLAFTRQEQLNPQDRSFVNGYQPDRGLSPDTTGTPFATHTGLAGTAIGATFRVPGDNQLYNRANLLSFQGKCDSYPEMSQYLVSLWGAANAPLGKGCSFDYGGQQVLIQPVDRTNLVARGTMELTKDATVFAEFTGSKVKARSEFESQQITTTGALAGAQYPVNGPYYQDLSAYIPTFDRTRPIAYRWRCVDCGTRQIETEADAYRFLLGLEGTMGGWDYKFGASTAQNSADAKLIDGYFYQSAMIAALASGLINPWLAPGQSQTPAAMALIQGAKANGVHLYGGEAKLTQFDGSITGDVYQMGAGAVSVAAGFDIRKEEFKFAGSSPTIATINGAPGDPDFAKVSRDVKAVYGEVVVPFTKELEATLQVRYDDYSDFGGTTNPKAAFRWQPMKELLFRGSANSGFRAPTFQQLFAPISESQLPGNIQDPVLCPLNPGNPTYCALRPNGLTGGNPGLQPETSKQWQLGFVVAPTPWATASIDYWQVKREDRIYQLTPQQVVANYTTFPENIIRDANGNIAQIRAGFVNAAGDETSGFDIAILVNRPAWDGKLTVGLDGTYTHTFKSKVFENDPFPNLVGLWSSRDLFTRWKHTLKINFERGPWNAQLTQTYTSSYKDEVPPGVATVPGFNPYVDSYILYHLTATYTGIKNLTLMGGIKNLFNTDPSFTAHNVDFLSGAGWDPRVADPRGRSFIASVTYKF